jgi:hypothetical protein
VNLAMDCLKGARFGSRLRSRSANLLSQVNNVPAGEARIIAIYG